MKLEGKVWRYGDNVDTDVIIPARYLNSFDPKDLAAHAMVDIDETFAPNVKVGDIMVAGISVVIASSFARIFYRNAINVGLAVLEIGDAVDEIHGDDILSVDLSTGKIQDLTAKKEFTAQPLPGFIQDIAAAGGLINYVKEKA